MLDQSISWVIYHFNKERVEDCLNHPSRFETARIGQQDYLLIYSFSQKVGAERLVKKLHALGFGARSIKGEGKVTGTSYYFVYVRRK